MAFVIRDRLQFRLPRFVYTGGGRRQQGSQQSGISLFFKDYTGSIFHTYSTYSRGMELMNAAYSYLDLAPKGRDEGSQAQCWVRRHDEYEPDAPAEKEEQL